MWCCDMMLALTFLCECVAGGDAISVSDYTGEGAQILQRNTVEDGSWPRHKKTGGQRVRKDELEEDIWGSN